MSAKNYKIRTAGQANIPVLGLNRPGIVGDSTF